MPTLLVSGCVAWGYGDSEAPSDAGNPDAGKISERDVNVPPVDAALTDAEAGGVSSGTLVCRNMSCGSAAPICCVEKLVAYPETNPDSDFSCVPAGGACALSYQCDSDGDCPAGTSCCGGYVPGGGGRVAYQCAPTVTCAAVSVALGCSQPSDCARVGEVCCGTLNAFINGGINDFYYSQTGCRAAALCADDSQRAFCRTDSDCPDPASVCGDSTLLPGKRVCRAASLGGSF